VLNTKNWNIISIKRYDLIHSFGTVFVVIWILSCWLDSSWANKQLITVSLRPSVVLSFRSDNIWEDWEGLSEIWRVDWIISDSSSIIVANDGGGRVLIYI
jgi:hypothetical protein